MAFRLTVKFENGYEEEHYYHNESTAEMAKDSWLSEYSQGENCCDEAGEGCPGGSVEDVVIEEVDNPDIEDYEYDD